MTTDEPKLVDYASPQDDALPPGRRVGPAFFGGTAILACLFFFASLVVESQTSDFLALHGRQLGTFSISDSLQSRLLKHRDTDNLIEFLWAFPATFVFFYAAIAVPPQTGWRLRWPVFLVTLLGALAYSWMRWGLTLADLKVGEVGDFLVAMLLAGAVGVAVGAARRVTTGTGKGSTGVSPVP